MIAAYDLAKRPTTFDFAAWIVNAKTMGATEVVFFCDGPLQTKKYPEAVALHRLEHILKPICDLAGLPYRMGERAEGIDPGYSFGDVERTYCEHGRLEKLRPLYSEARSGYITITVRESIRNKYRDSNRAEWEKFAAWVDKPVVWVEDADKEFISIADRMALYAGADMNLGVNNGPMCLLCFSDLPYALLNMIPHGYKGGALELHMYATGFPPESQFSFRTTEQRIFWSPDTFDNIVRAYKELCA